MFAPPKIIISDRPPESSDGPSLKAGDKWVDQVNGYVYFIIVNAGWFSVDSFWAVKLPLSST